MNKRILMVAYDFPPNWGGVATYGWELAHAFDKQGVQVDVLCQNYGPKIESSLNLIPIDLPFAGIAAVPALFLKLRHQLKKQKYDWVFCNLWSPEGIAIYLANKTLSSPVPFSVSVHAMEVIDSKGSLKKRIRGQLSFLKHWVLQKAQNVFCVSEFSANLVRSLGTDNVTPEVVANGANPNRFEKSIATTKAPSLFTAARLVPHKGIDQVLKVIPRLLQHHPNLTYRISGTGPDQVRLQQIVANLNISKHVEFLGKITQEQLQDEYSQAQLFVMLSRQIEHQVAGFGLVFLEAALCGTPSLGGDSGGISDAIIEDKTGWLVDPDDSEAIYQKLNALLSHPYDLEAMGAQANRITREQRTWDHTAAKLLKAMFRGKQ